MSTSGAQQLRDCIVQHNVHQERDRFIKSIREDAVLRLASQHHDAEPCAFFTPPSFTTYYTARGSYNICYFVLFRSGERWVVRVPLRPCLAFPAQSKLRCEIATMKLVAEMSVIPVPKIRAYAIDDDPDSLDPLSTFVMLDYVEGTKLSSLPYTELTSGQKDNLYTSLADIYIQLRRFEFSSIGRLRHDSGGFKVAENSMSIDVNMQELEGLAPLEVQASYHDEDGALKSADKYTEMLLSIAYNGFVKGRGGRQGSAADSLYHLHLFRKHAKEWVDTSLDGGPFVLVHGDLNPFNIMVDESMTITAVLDWEWSRVVPVQFFNPPLWLEYSDEHLVIKIVYERFLRGSFNELLNRVRERERERYGNTLLADEWAKGKDNGGFLIASALENWTYIDWVASHYINRRYYREIGLEGRIRTFLEEDPLRASVASEKERQNTAYSAELDRLRTGEESRLAVTLGSTAVLVTSISFLIWRWVHS